MQGSESFSKGCFAFNPNAGRSKKSARKRRDPLEEISSESWYLNYKTVWNKIENELESIEDDLSEKLLNDIVQFIAKAPTKTEAISTAILLTGVNLPDHGYLFNQLCEQLSKEKVTERIALLSHVECSTLKTTVENVVLQLMDCSQDQLEGSEDEEDMEEEVEESGRVGKRLKKSSCTLSRLEELERAKETRGIPSPSKKSRVSPQPMVIILSEFEAFNSKILHQFLLLLSCYSKRLPLVVVIGVATTVNALHNALPHKVTSKLALRLFQSQPSVHFLNNTIDKVFLKASCPFQLGPKVLKFLIDVFLFYDFSVQGFTQGVKYCVMGHFYSGAWSVLCSDKAALKKVVRGLSSTELKTVCHLPSFKAYTETMPQEEREALLKDETQTKDLILSLMKNLRQYLEDMYSCLNILHILVCNLPQAPLGKQLRDLYCASFSGKLYEKTEYQECFKLLLFQAKDQLIEKLDKILVFLRNSKKKEWLTEVEARLEVLREEIKGAKLEAGMESPSKQSVQILVKNRAQLKLKLAELGKKSETDFEKARRTCLVWLRDEVLPKGLGEKRLAELPLHETVLVGSGIQELKRHLVASPRASLHLALNNPTSYLECDCCQLNFPTEIRKTMPDICVAYKLHLECGALINMYDWLQAFVTVVDPKSAEEDTRQIDPKIQARFTQAVAELEFLGFVQSSKCRTDHVARLTWGGTS